MNYITAVFVGELIFFLIQALLIKIILKEGSKNMADKQDEGLILLREIKSINRMIEELQMQINSIYTMLTSTTVKPKDVNIMSSGDDDPMATKMGKILEYQEQLQKYQSKLCAKKLLAIRTIERMDIERQQIILMRYFRGLTVEQIKVELERSSYYHTWEIVHQAEEEFCNIYGQGIKGDIVS